LKYYTVIDNKKFYFSSSATPLAIYTYHPKTTCPAFDFLPELPLLKIDKSYHYRCGNASRLHLTFISKRKEKKNDQQTGKAVINIGGKAPVRAVRPSNNEIRKKQANFSLDKGWIKIR